MNIWKRTKMYSGLLKMNERQGSHHGSRKILFTNHFSQEENSADHNSWEKKNMKPSVNMLTSLLIV
jgi:hypothetical protein